LKFLENEGAIIEDDKVIHFGAADDELMNLKEHTMIASLDDYGVISVSGEDSLDFLQNQFSNDVRTVSESHSQLNAYCSPKGRVLALFRLVKQGENFYLLLPQERLQATLNRLKMFVLRSKVTLEDASDQMGIMGITGNNAIAAVNTLISAAPEHVDDCVCAASLSVIRAPGESNRYALFATYDGLQEAWRKCKPLATPVSANYWAYQNVQAGVPEVLGVNSDEFVPQMLNLHSLNAINFKKGCYPGQEVVARMHYLGKQKRRMYLAHIDSTGMPAIGANLYNEADAAGQSVGKIVNIVASPNGGYDALVVMQIATVEKGDPVLTQENASLNFKELPYVVEVEGSK
jgi:folate-binding protein YgfZ